MAKKITVANDVLDSIKTNISEANTANNGMKPVVEEHAEPVEQETAAPSSQKKMDKMLEALNNTSKRKRVGERDSDRGALAHVHVPSELKRQLEDMKSAFRMSGHNVTIDTLMYWSLYDFVNRYYETFTLRDVKTQDNIKDEKVRQELRKNFKNFLRAFVDADE